MRGGGCLRLALLFAALGVAAARFGPPLVERLFPAPVEPEGAGPAGPDAAGAAAELAAALAQWGAVAGQPVELPRGRQPGDLEAALRARPGLAGVEVYVTPQDELLWRLRVLRGSQELLSRPVVPWLPPRPPAPLGREPALALVLEVAEPSAEGIEPLAELALPIAVGLPAFAPGTLSAVRAAIRGRVEILLRVDPQVGLAEQLAAVPEASGLLVSDAAPAGDYGGRVVFLAGASCPPGARCVPIAGRLEDGVDRLRALALRRGHGVVLAGIAEREAAVLFAQEARGDGYRITFPAEVLIPRAGAGGGGPALGTP